MPTSPVIRLRTTVHIGPCKPSERPFALEIPGGFREGVAEAVVWKVEWKFDAAFCSISGMRWVFAFLTRPASSCDRGMLMEGERRGRRGTAFPEKKKQTS